MVDTHDLFIRCYTSSISTYNIVDGLMYFNYDDYFEASTHKGIKWLLNQKATKSANN